MKQFSPWKFAPIWLAITIDSMGYGLVYPIMTLIFTSTSHPILPPETSEAARNFYLGLSYLLYPLGMLFGASFLSDLSDRIGRKKVLVYSILGISLSFLAMGIGTSIDNLLLLFIGRAMAGLFAGAQPTAQAAIADMSTEETKKRNLSMMTFVISFGIILGPILGGFFADSTISPLFSFSTPFYLTAILALINFFWIALKVEESFYPEEKKKIDFLRPLRIFFEAYQNKRVFFIALIFFLMQLGFSTFYQLIQVRMATQFSYSTWDLGVFNTGIGISFAGTMWISMKYILKHFKEGVIGVASLLLTGICLGITAILQVEAGVITFSFLSAGFDMIAYAMLMTAFSHAVGSNAQGWVMGIFGAILAISWALTGFSTNLLTFINADGIIFLGSLCMLASATLMFFYVRKYAQPKTT